MRNFGNFAPYGGLPTFVSGPRNLASDGSYETWQAQNRWLGAFGVFFPRTTFYVQNVAGYRGQPPLCRNFPVITFQLHRPKAANRRDDK